MDIIAKFTVQSVTEFAWGDAKQVKLGAAYDESLPEDQRFSKATPNGTIDMYVSNPAALAELEVGRKFYVRFEPIEDAK